MCEDRMTKLVVLLASALCLFFSPQTQGQGAIPPPVNLSIESCDFNTILKWEVADGNRTTRFNVYYREYENNIWRPVCLNISKHYCDLSNAFVASQAAQEVISGYYTRVQAITASQESPSVLTNRFTFGQNATLSPPTVLLAASGNDLTVEVKYPALNSKSSNLSFDFLSYNVCYRDRHRRNTKSACLKNRSQQQHFRVPEGVVCVSAEVLASIFDLKGNKSKETCLEIHSTNLSDSTNLTWPPLLKYKDNITSDTYDDNDYEYIDEEEDEYDDEYEEDEEALGDDEEHPLYTMLSDDDPKDNSVSAVVIPTVVGFIIVVISISGLIYFLKCKKKLVLPKSLAHIIVNEKVYHVINPKTEESNECVLIKPEEMTKDTDIDLNHELQEEVTYSSDNVGHHTINADESKSKLVNADSTDLYAAKMNINGTDLKCVGQHDIEGGISDQDSSRDSCPTHLDTMKENYTPANWGYDKPQIPLNMV